MKETRGHYYPYEPIPEEDKPYFERTIKKVALESETPTKFVSVLKKKGFKIGSHTEKKLHDEYYNIRKRNGIIDKKQDYDTELN